MSKITEAVDNAVDDGLETFFAEEEDEEDVQNNRGGRRCGLETFFNIEEDDEVEDCYNYYCF
jgi:hypothetical protein